MKSTDIYTATIKITLRPSILDPQGKSTLNALENLGYDNVSSVRIGKCIELKIDAESDLDARDTACGACEVLLANPVMEDYDVLIEPSDV